jgi:hypothetical protein
MFLTTSGSWAASEFAMQNLIGGTLVSRVTWESACFELGVSAVCAHSVNVADHVCNGIVNIGGVNLSVTDDQIG